jgi:alpha-beta hydrolase superfamily lysophospholipase
MHVKQILKGLGLISIGLAAWEMGWPWYEKRQAKNRSNYWENYYSPALVERSNQLRQTHLLRSTGVDVHIDFYPQRDREAPVIIFNHGAAGYSRIFVELALALYDLGYTVILPDQRGQGFSEGRRGDYVIAECTQNIVDVAKWAKSCFQGPLFMMGGSVGGALTYYAVVAG